MNDFLFLYAFLIDIIFGDPPMIFPHPIVMIGKVITFLENILTTVKNRKLAGLILLLTVIVITFISVYGLKNIFKLFDKYTYLLLTSILGSFTLSIRSLHLESKKVADALAKNDLVSARINLSFIVSRDTKELQNRDITRSVIETVSENLNDGIIAPLFYFAIGGVEAAFVYKAVNTLDSMVGYKNSKYLDFGFFSAKLDDILNFIPARLSGITILLSAFILQYDWKRAFNVMVRDHNNIESPNSGWSESAVAGALRIQLGGPTPYFGEWKDKPFIGDEVEALTLTHIKKSYFILYTSSVIFVLIIFLIKFFALKNF